MLQTWRHWHCFIVDDGSSGDLLVQMKTCLQDDDRFTLHAYEDNVGVYRNFERGLQLCTDRATAIAFCDQDDIWQPQKLERLLAELRNEQAMMVHSDLEAIDGASNTLEASCWAYEGRTPEAATVPLLLVQNVVTGCSSLFRASLLSFVLPFPHSSTGHWLHDWWVALVAASVGRVVAVRQPLVRYRQHERNLVGAVRKTGGPLQLILAWQRNHFRITGKGYLAYRELAHALRSRLGQHSLPAIYTPSSSLHFARLAWQSRQTEYGAEGAAIRLAVLALLVGDVL